MPQSVTPLLHFDLNESPIEYVHEFNFLGLTLDSSLSFKFHLTKIGNKISGVIGLLHKLKHIFPSYLLRLIYNSLILPHMNYSLLAWGAYCYNIGLLQKKAVRVINFKSPLAQTERILKGMDQLKLPDVYTCHLIKLFYKYFFPSYILIMIYNSLSLPHFNYSLLAWGSKCHKIEILQKTGIWVVKFKSPIAHTEPILKKMNPLKLSDMYTCYLLKLYYKLYRNRLPPYFENCILVYGELRHNLRNRCIHLPDVR